MEIYQNVYRLKRPQTNNLIRSNPKIENNSRQSRTLLNWASSSISRSIVQRMALSGGWFDDRLHHPLGQHPAAGSTIHSIRGRANEIVLAVKFAPNALTSQWVLFINRKLKFNWCVCPWLATRWPPPTTSEPFTPSERHDRRLWPALFFHFFSFFFKKTPNKTNSQLQGDIAATLQDK